MPDDRPPLLVSEQLREYIRQGQADGVLPNTYKLAWELDTDHSHLYRWLLGRYGISRKRLDLFCAYLGLVLVPADYLRKLEFQVSSLRSELCKPKNP